MNEMAKPPQRTVTGEEVRADLVPAASYIDPKYVALEKERLWPRVWQVACREEEIPKPGDYVTYEIADDSFSVVRLKDGSIAAYYNVCPHRGRRLTEGCGHMARFHCKFHGWKWSLEGKSVDVIDREDWGDTLAEKDIELVPARVGSWGGWVFICMDETAESLEEYLHPLAEQLAPFEFEKMRYAWRKHIVLPCNWKVALEAFDEGYHVQTTHRQLLTYFDDLTYSEIRGKHAFFGYGPTNLFGMPSPRLGDPKGDLRKGLHQFNQNIWDTLKATATEEMLAAGKRLEELPEDADPVAVYTAFAQFHREEAEKAGRPFPDVPVETLMGTGTDWHLFPNIVFLHQPTNVLWYRSRPNGDNPDSCIFEIHVIERFAEGAEPKVEVEYSDDWRTADWGLILAQDFQNMGEVQKGMKSRAFKGARTNPVQEKPVSNFHQVLHHYLADKN